MYEEQIAANNAELNDILTMANELPDAGFKSIDETTPTTLTGILKGNGATIEAAVAGSDYAAAITAQTVVIPASGWSVSSGQCIQTVGVDGMRSTWIALVSPDASSIRDYAESGVFCSVQGYNSLTFTATTPIAPTVDLTVNVIRLG